MNILKPIVLNELDSTGDLFGISEDMFTALIQQHNPNACVKKVEQLNTIHPDYYGGRGEKTIVKVYFSSGSVDNEASFFIKKHSQKNPNEALHYKYLTQFKAPIPQLFAYYSEANQQDVIVTEVIQPFYVDDDPVFMLDKGILEPFVEVTALFNSTKINDEYRAIIANGYDLLDDKLKPFEKKLRSMFESIQTDSSYQGLKSKVTRSMEAKVITILKKACQSIEPMPKGLYHWDHKPRNMGWSNRQQKHVIFDLEDTLWGPRFYNIGMWLGGADCYEEKYLSREKLAEAYLSIYNARTKQNVSVDCLLHESYPLWVAYKIETLLYYYYESGPKPYRLRNKDPQEYKHEMNAKFVDLANLLCSLD